MKKLILGFLLVLSSTFVDAQSISISDIQGMTDVSPYVGQIVETSGFVTAVAPSGYFIQDAGLAWSGIYVYDNTNIPEIGDEIGIAAEVDEYYEMTELKNVSSFEVLSQENNLYEPLELLTALLTEGFEGCLLTVSGTCTLQNNEYGEAIIEINDAMEIVKTNDLIYLYDFQQGFNYTVTGVVEYSFGEYKICPRDEYDISEMISIAEMNTISTTIKMVSNFLEIESSLRGQQDFVIYNIAGDVVMKGAFDGTISIPMHHFETATYLIRIGDLAQLIVKQ